MNGISLLTPMNEIEEYIRAKLQEQEAKVVKALSYIGEACIKQARNYHGYTDRTGNLTASIGYGIIHRGDIVSSSGFKAKKKSGKDGELSGRKLLEDLAMGEFASLNEYALIVVAGRRYAIYVQARGKDVLGGAELVANDLIRKMNSYRR